MPTLTVPVPFASIQDAVDAAAVGDIIEVASGYAGNETVTVGVNDLTIDVPEPVTGVQIVLKDPVTKLTLAGSSPVRISGSFRSETLTGNAGDNIIDGGSGNDSIRGGDGDDELSGGSFFDELFGGSGNDRLNGGTENDQMSGGPGDDVYVVDGAADGVFEEADAGTDTVESSISYKLPVNVERLVLTGTGGIKGTGNDGANTIVGNSAPNLLAGLDGDDSLQGGGGKDTLDGGAGNDTLDGGDGTGDVVTYAGAGAGVTVSLTVSGAQDTGGSGSDTLSFVEDLVGSGFADTLTGDGNQNELLGGDGDDTLDGGDRGDELDGGGGADIMIGGGGNDDFFVDNVLDTVIELAGGGVSDTIDTTLNRFDLSDQVESLFFVGAGNFTATGNGLANLLVGRSGDDTLDGGPGNDVLSGGNGSDTASYASATAGVKVSLLLAGDYQNTVGAGRDKLFFMENLAGSAFNDKLTGDGASNVLSGALGNDLLVGGAGGDTLHGGLGNDTLDGSGGSDTASYASATSGVKVSLLRAGEFQNTVGAGSDKLLFVENLVGSAFADRLTGNSANNVLSGGVGDDVLMGGLGDDALAGGDGLDTASYAEAAGSVTVSLALAGPQNTAGAGSDTLSSIEMLAGSAFDDALTASDAAGTLIGGAGNDLLVGGTADDSLDGGAGSDTLMGGNGNDTATYAIGGAVTASLGNPATNAGDAAGDTYASIENLRGSDFADSLTGNGGDNRLTGGAGADTLNGAGGRDTASYAGAGAAVTASLADPAINAGEAAGDAYSAIENLLGSSFADILVGDAGANRLDGGKSGLDQLTGGPGVDSFVFARAVAPTTVVTVTDFTVGSDRIELSLAIFDAAGPAGKLAAAAYFGGAAAHDASDRILYDAVSGDLLYDRDGTGSATAKVFGHVGPGLTMSAIDFRLA